MQGRASRRVWHMPATRSRSSTDQPTIGFGDDEGSAARAGVVGPGGYLGGGVGVTALAG
jgi:hypothetical protein